MSPSRITVAVAPATEYENRRPFFDMLSVSLPVTFVPHVSGRLAGLDGIVLLSEDETVEGEQQLSSYRVHSSTAIPSTQSPMIGFTSSALVHRAFRNSSLIDASLASFFSVPDSYEVLAQVAHRPVWSVDRTSRRESHHVGVQLPAFASGDFFHAHFRDSRWFAMVPLLHFLRSLLGSEGWNAPAPRATFIIDDPNLHHRTYGYIDFASLAKHAAAHNYHASIATVPLDAWYFNRKVAALLRGNRRQISLMMHGVNHVADELARPYSREAALQLMAEGLRRISNFELRSGVKVDRVMAAPHGAFAEPIADPMLRLGYEAGCISVGSLVRWNPQKSWRPDLGLPMAQPFGTGGFPVFHRMSTKETEIRLSAFLGHPVVIATHHQDYIANFARIEPLANMVNQILSPQWLPIEEISRTNYLSKLQDGVLQVTPYARRLAIPIPKGIEGLKLLASPFCAETMIRLGWLASGEAQTSENTPLVKCGVSNNVMQVSLLPTDTVDYKKVAAMRHGLWPITRRVLAEGRDRVKPMLSFGSPR